MKKIYFCILVILLGFLNTNAQWVVQIPTNIAENRSIYMTSSDAGYIAGSSGIILKTTNGGVLWDTITSGTIDTLRSVFFINDSTGYVSGANGTLRKTTDAGNLWTPLSSGVPNLLRSIFFVNDSIGFVCGGGGVILRTTDGGNTWTPQVSGTTQDLINIRFINPDKGYCVSSLGTFLSGIILKTIDGGNTWTTVYTDANGLLGLAVVGDSVVYAGGGNQLIVKSIDAGANWSVLNPASTAYHFRSAFFLTPDSGYVTGDSGKIFYTTNGGVSWINQGINANGVLSVFSVNSDTSYACGANGAILKYTRPCSPGAPLAIVGNSAVCSGSIETYSIPPVQNATSYIWQIPAGASILSGQGDTLVTIQFGSASGNIVVTASNICGQGPPANVLITVKTTPGIPVISQVAGVLHSTSLVGNQWYFNGVAITGATNDNYLPTQNGTYTVIVTYTNGCSATSAPFTVVNAGIDEKKIEYEFKVQPNPVNENLFIEFNVKSAATVSIEIYDIVGKKVADIVNQKKLQGKQKLSLNCKEWSPGNYIIKMQIDQQILVEKLQKN